MPALRRGLAVLRLIAGKAGPVTAAALARELALPRSTTYHLLAELADAGFVTHLPASGRAMLAHLPAAQVRALFPNRAAFVDRTGRGPAHLPALRGVLARERWRGWAVEDGHVSAGFASVAAPVFDHGGHPVAAISTTFRHTCPGAAECGEHWPDLAAATLRAAVELGGRIGGRPR
ncbi:IclR helix-turn-helix domain-containing protein [Actinokineospora iranica]|uniref:IclR helix-turn-helix domain-containing protein n=1 Tax=Actinokineospora iranica TaxID=1271860 RepID=A0A1G6T2A9_9PSEU|nr:IclR helix-turn-helix domain-containing protein [Actinokineospora iranica]